MSMLESLYESFNVGNLTLEEAQQANRLKACVKLNDGTEIKGIIENESINDYLVVKTDSSVFQIWEETVEEIELVDLDKEAENFEGPRQKTIAFDLDGTITGYESGQYPEIGAPLEGIKELIDELKEQDIRIVIWTCRDASEIESTLDRYGIQYDEINQNSEGTHQSNKISADIYVDDRAINFDGDVEKLRKSIEDFKPWYEVADSSEEDTEESVDESEGNKKLIKHWATKGGKFWIKLYRNDFKGKESYEYEETGGSGNLGYMSEEEAIAKMEEKIMSAKAIDDVNYYEIELGGEDD